MISRLISVMAAAATAATSMIVASAADAQGLGIGQCYVRIDGGYGWSAGASGQTNILPAFGAGLGGVNNSWLDNNWVAEMGLGCRLIQRVETVASIKDAPMVSMVPTPFRGDITGIYLAERRYTGAPGNAPLAGVGPASFVDAKLHTELLMFNGYYDMPKMLGVMPYFGVGLGMAFHGLNPTIFSAGAVSRSLENSTDTVFAWSLMTGFSVDLGASVMLDVGYRYLAMEDISTTSSVVGLGFRLSNPSQHQAKVGFRIPVGIWFD